MTEQGQRDYYAAVRTRAATMRMQQMDQIRRSRMIAERSKVEHAREQEATLLLLLS